MNLSKTTNTTSMVTNAILQQCNNDHLSNGKTESATTIASWCKDKNDITAASKSKPLQSNDVIQTITSSTTTASSSTIDEFTSKFSMYNANEELLGSVTTLSSPAVRTSARVIQKMKMDSIRPASPPITDKKESQKDDRPQQKTPSQPKANKVIWTNIERNLFFEAINEYGKDFDAISHYINNKQKRKNVTDPTYKTKENVRQLYHQTFHKLSKYLRFSDGKFNQK